MIVAVRTTKMICTFGNLALSVVCIGTGVWYRLSKPGLRVVQGGTWPPVLDSSNLFGEFRFVQYYKTLHKSLKKSMIIYSKEKSL